MKFKELTQTDIDYARKVYTDKTLTWDERMNILVQFFGRCERTVRKWCSEKLDFKERVEIVSEQFEEAKRRTFDKTKKRFIITWAQSETDVFLPFLRNIEAYADYINADIHIIAGRYKNPTSLAASSKVKAEETWQNDVVKYLDANRHDIHKYMSIMSDVKIQPTAANPMSGMEGISGMNSCIFGGPKVQFRTIPVLKGYKPKMMMTTGAVTKKNYTDTKAGIKGSFHHTYGFVIVELKDDETYFVRQVTANNLGVFTDLIHKVENGQVTIVNSISAIVLGDLHVGEHDYKVMNETLRFMDKIVPKHVVLHDVFDGTSINHHEMNNPFSQYKKEINGTNSLKAEVDHMLDYLELFDRYENVVIVRSNHDDFVDRWLQNTDWRKTNTMKNSLEYMEYCTAILTGAAKNGIIPWLIDKRFPKFKTLGRDDSYFVKNWQLGQHGDVGANGARGNIETYRRLNTKIVIGHSHAPCRMDGVLQVGTSTKLRVGYNVGPSGWLNSHVIIHNDGKAQHINLFDGEFTTFEY